jgi:hypothetical protein
LVPDTVKLNHKCLAWSKPLPTLLKKKKEPLWYRIPQYSTTSVWHEERHGESLGMQQLAIANALPPHSSNVEMHRQSTLKYLDEQGLQ